MAMSGGISKLVSKGTPSGWPGPVSLYVYYKEKSQSVANNQTVLSLGMYVTTPSGWGIGEWTDWNGSYVGTATSGSNCKSFNGGIPNFSGTRWLVENFDVTVKHDNDGSKKVTIYWHWGVNSVWSGVMNNPSGSFSVDLTTIPRASSITAAAPTTLGNKCSVKWVPNSTIFRYRLKFSLGGWSGTTGVIHPNTTSEYTYTEYPIPADVAKQLPNSPDGNMAVTLYTYSDATGTTPVGSDDETFRVIVPPTAKPIVAMDVSPVHSFDDEFGVFDGLYIQGLSKVKATISATTLYYGTGIDHCYMTVKGKTYGGDADYTSDYITDYGDILVSGHVVDNRTYDGFIEKTITVIPYAPPKLLNVSVVRCNANGETDDDEDADGPFTYLKIAAKRDYSLCMSGNAQKNFCEIQYRIRNAKGVELSPWKTILARDNLTTDEVISDPLEDGGVNEANTYLVDVWAKDDIGKTAPVTVVIPTDAVYWHRDGANNALGLGKYAEEKETLDMAWNIKTNKSITAEGNVIVGGTLTAANIGRIGYYRNLDFDTLTVHTGYYADGLSPSGAGSKHYPVDATGVLEVIAYEGTFAYQTYRTYTGSIYTRSYYVGSGWTAWVQLV